MPLKCKACGQCHTARRGCADVYATLERMAGPMPEPKGTPGEWVLECGKHHQPYRACCEGRYTLKWEWKDADPTPPPAETDAGSLAHAAWRRLFQEGIATGDAYSRGRVIAEIEGVVRARLATAEAENGRLKALLESCCVLRGPSADGYTCLDVARVNGGGMGLCKACAALEPPPHD